MTARRLSLERIANAASVIARRSRAFGAPVAGGLAMAAALLPTDLPLVPAAAVGVACYLAGLLTFERLVFPADLARVRAAVWR